MRAICHGTMLHSRHRTQSWRLRLTGAKSPAQGRAYLRCPSPLLSGVPVIDILASLVFRKAISLLNFAFQLIPATVNHIEIIVGELAPFLLNFAFDLLPISFDPIPVHLSLLDVSRGEQRCAPGTGSATGQHPLPGCAA